jgi:hypothetical protein
MSRAFNIAAIPIDEKSSVISSEFEITNDDIDDEYDNLHRKYEQKRGYEDEVIFDPDVIQKTIIHDDDDDDDDDNDNSDEDQEPDTYSEKIAKKLLKNNDASGRSSAGVGFSHVDYENTDDDIFGRGYVPDV